MTTPLTRPLVALATVLACLLTIQSPASATVFATTVTDGDLILTKTGNPTWTWPLDTSTPCPGTTLQVDATATSFEVTGFSNQSLVTFPGTTTQYVLVLSRTSSTPGTNGLTGITSATLGLSSTLHILTAPCTAGTAVCRLGTTLHLTGSLTGLSSSAVGTLDSAGATVVATGLCGVPFSGYIGSTARLDDLEFHLT